MEDVDTFIGILVLIAWGAVIIGMAAGVTYAMVKLFPTREAQPEGEPTAGDS